MRIRQTRWTILLVIAALSGITCQHEGYEDFEEESRSPIDDNRTEYEKSLALLDVSGHDSIIFPPIKPKDVLFLESSKKNKTTIFIKTKYGETVMVREFCDSIKAGPSPTSESWYKIRLSCLKSGKYYLEAHDTTGIVFMMKFLKK